MGTLTPHQTKLPINQKSILIHITETSLIKTEEMEWKKESVS